MIKIQNIYKNKQTKLCYVETNDSINYIDEFNIYIEDDEDYEEDEDL